MPQVAPVEDGEVLADVELEPLVRWKGPLTKIVEVGGCRDSKGGRAADYSFSEEYEIV